MRLFRSALSCLGLLLLTGGLALPAQTHWAVAKTFHIGGDGGWDYVTVDAPRHRLFVTRSTHTMAIDTNTGKVLADIPGQVRSHGIALVPKLDRGFITDGGGSGAILVFDMKTYKVLGRIHTMPDSDGIIYDSSANRVLAVSGDGHALMVLNPDTDPTNGKMDSTIDLGGAPEFLASDGSGRVYINLQGGPAVMPPSHSGQHGSHQQPYSAPQQGYQAPNQPQYQSGQQVENTQQDEVTGLISMLLKCFCK